MTQTLAAFAKGHKFAPVSLELTEDLVRRYVEAVEDEAIAAFPSTVPPMALAALAIRSLLDSAGLPEGAIHVAQDLSFHSIVRTGDSVSVRATIASRGERAGWVLMGVDLSLVDAEESAVMTGRATITFPAEGA